MDDRLQFLKLWEKEAAATRKVISRIPEGSTYKPDPKSRTAREIAWLIVREEAVLAEGFDKGVLEWEEQPAPSSVKDILAAYDKVHATLDKRLGTSTAERWQQKIPFLFGGQQVMNETGADNAWGFLLDIIHHRGQISTYLRPMGSSVPQIYGPTADEP
jgi:uncharacterized damage-inducible protein DinB